MVAFAAGIALLVLDEPTTGLDPMMESVFRARIDGCRAGGHPVLLSSHILAEVERLCDRVTIIRAGLAVETGHPGRAPPPDPHLDSDRAAPRPAVGLDGLTGVHDLAVEGNRASFEIDTDRARRGPRRRSCGPACGP